MIIENMRVLVTGGAGFIGSHVVDTLERKGNKVIIVDDFSTGKEENIRHHLENPNISVIRSDIRDFPTMVKVTKDVDVVFHLAVNCLRVSFKDPQAVHDVNATGTLNVVRAAFENNVKRFIYTSSSESYGTAVSGPMSEDHPLNPTTVYGASKLAGEAYSRAFWHTYGFPVTVVRPFNTYGPREHYEGASGEVLPRFVFWVMNGMQPVIFGDGMQTRDFTWVNDTAGGIVLAAECDALVGDCVNVSRGEEVSINELCEIVLTTLGRTDLKPKYMSDGRPGDVYRHFGDNRKARQLMGFEPTVDIKEGIERYINWLKNQSIDMQQWIDNTNVVNW